MPPISNSFKPYHAHFDCFSGAASDMLLASCLDASPNSHELMQTIKECLKKGIPDIKDEFDIHIQRVWKGKGSIVGLNVIVDSFYNHKSASVPEHDDSHNHDHSHNHSRGNLRNLPQIINLLNKSSTDYTPLTVRQLSIQTFTELAIAESHTHGTSSINNVHFHEVGAIDSIVDIVGTLLALHHLHVSSISCSKLPMGEGSVITDHGELPIPAFATMRLLVGMKTCKGPGIDNDTETGELVTPTGAALLRVLTGVVDEVNTSNNEHKKDETNKNPFMRTKSRIGRCPAMTLRLIGIGAGKKEFKYYPNILRLILGTEVELD